MIFFGIFRRTSFCQAQYAWDILRRPQASSILATLVTDGPTRRRLLIKQRRLPQSRLNEAAVTVARVSVIEQSNDRSATLADVAQALSTLGVSPRDMASILQALKGAGALRAEIVVQ